MLQILHKILVIIIALIVLLSSLSFTVQKQTPLVEVTDIPYCDVVDACGMTVNKCDMENPSEYSSQKVDYCDNH